MNIKTRVDRLEEAIMPTLEPRYFFIHWVSPDGNATELLGYSSYDRYGKETSITRLAGESVDELRIRAKESVSIPEGGNGVIFFEVH
jgi:hypothetical protein